MMLSTVPGDDQATRRTRPHLSTATGNCLRKFRLMKASAYTECRRREPPRDSELVECRVSSAVSAAPPTGRTGGVAEGSNHRAGVIDLPYQSTSIEAGYPWGQEFIRRPSSARWR